MNKEQAAHELNQIHIVYAKQLTQIGNALSSSGEDGVILWLCQQEGDIFAVDIIIFEIKHGKIEPCVRII